MTLIKTLLTFLVLVFFAISFMTFDLASLNLDQQAGQMLRQNPVAVGIVGGILLIGLVADRMVGAKHVS